MIGWAVGWCREHCFYDITNQFFFAHVAIENSKKRGSNFLKCTEELHREGVRIMVIPGMEQLAPLRTITALLVSKSIFSIIGLRAGLRTCIRLMHLHRCLMRNFKDDNLLRCQMRNLNIHITRSGRHMLIMKICS